MLRMQLHNFLDYIYAFNSREYKKQHDFYHPNVHLVIPDPEIGSITGSSSIMKHYSRVHASAQETVVPMFVMIDEKRIFFSMETYFYYTQPTDAAVHGYKVAAGDVIRVKVWAVYNMVDGKMARITCNGLYDELLGQVIVDDFIRKSWSRADDDVKACWRVHTGLDHP